MGAVVDCLAVRSGPFPAFCCLLQLLWPFEHIFLRRSLVDMLCASPFFLSDWEIVELIYKGKDSAEKARWWMVIGYNMVLVCVILVVGFYE